MRDFDGKVALVVGGGSGIARESSRIFAGRGARVVVADRDEDKAAETVELIARDGGEASAFQVDGTSEDGVKAMIAHTIGTFGRLDVAHNNVGHAGTFKALVDVSVEEFEQAYRFNTLSCFLAMKYEVPEMLKAGGGAIVNTCSLAGLIGSPGQGPYVSAKHGVAGLTRTAALELATQNIRVNAICPGATDTPMLRASMEIYNAVERGLLKFWVEPMGRFGRSEEQAQAAVWLCSDGASFITGQALPVDGGHMAGNRAPDPDAQ